jgi:hypothetical protein
MLKKLLIASTIAFAAAGLATAAMAQAQAAPTPTCLARYEPMDGLCFNSVNGDIVLAKTPAAPAFTNANCGTGYVIIFETLCFSNTTGDVVFAEDVSVDTVRTAKK